jgi:ribose transport system permease protein
MVEDMGKRELNLPGLGMMKEVPPHFLLVMVLAAMFVIFAVVAPGFMTTGNMVNVLRQASSLFMLACGQTIAFLLGGFDVSQGSLVGFVSLVTAFALIRFGTVLGTLIGVLIGAGFGFIMGFLIARAKVLPSFIITLGFLFMIEGVTFIISIRPVMGLPESFSVIGAGMIGPIPVPVILFALVAIIFHQLLSQTQFGRNIYAIGGNEEAARLAGIRVDQTKIFAWVLDGFLVALGAIILTSRVNSGQPLLGGGLLLESIGAAVIGGTSVFGGRGGAIQAVLGVVFIAFLVNGLNLMGISAFVKDALTGAFIILAVWLGFRKK